MPTDGLATQRFKLANHVLLPIYVELAQTMGPSAPAQPKGFVEPEGEHGEHVADPEEWLAAIDSVVTPSQLRQFIQKSKIANRKDSLEWLIKRYVKRAGVSQPDLDKLDFLLVQYLSTCHGDKAEANDFPLDKVAALLEPLVGPLAKPLPPWSVKLNELADEMKAYEHLQDMTKHELVDRGRKLKSSIRRQPNDPTILITFARFNYLVRATFVLLWQADVWWIEEGLKFLETRGEYFLDCAAVGFSPIQPITELYPTLTKWKNPSLADYALDSTYRQLQGLRHIVDTAMGPVYE